MDNYRRLKKDGTPYGRYSTKASDKPVEGHYRYVQDTPTFESLVTKGGQGTRGDKMFATGAKEYDRPKKTEEKKSSPSKKAPAKKKNPEGEVSPKAAAEFRRKMKEEDMLRKMGERYDEIVGKPEMARGGAVQKKMSKVMGEYKAGTLRSGGTDKAVKNPKQAVAIAMSEARRLKK